MKYFLIILLTISIPIICLFTSKCHSEESKSEQIIAVHNIKLNIIPDKSFIESTDQFSYNGHFNTKTVTLLNSLEIYEMSHSTGNYDYSIEPFSETHNRITIVNKTNNSKAELPVFTFKYRGKVDTPPSETNLIQRHSNSVGIISAKENEGLYLPARAFYPISSDEMAMFDITITVPNDYTVITSGKKIKTIEGESAIYNYKTDFPIDDLTLVGGRFHKESKHYDGVEFALYTYQPTQHSEQYLNSSIEYYKLYTDLFGEYPFDAFRIVENFFATGFGMPGYTLLSGRLLQMPWVTLSAGSLAHEFVHNWWGNSVFVDYSQGNWCEALTTFSTNYYYNDLSENLQGGLDWRKRALISIDDLPADRLYPVSQFRYQRDTYDAVVGYQKGAFAMYEIYKFMGKEAFFAALRNFARDFKGKSAYWNDLIAAFEAESANFKYNVSIKDLSQQLLYSNDIPAIELNKVSFNSKTMTLNVTLQQSRDLYLIVPIEYSNNDTAVTVNHLINSKSNEISIKTDFIPTLVRIDPEYQALRKLNNWEKPYNIYRTLNSKPIVVMPEKNTADYEIAMGLYNMLTESGYNFESVVASELSDDLLNNNSLIVLGNIKSNSIYEKISSVAPKELQFDEQNIIHNGTKYPAGKHLLMFSSDHPSNKNHLCTNIYFAELADSAPFRRLFHYQSISMVLLSQDRAGRPVAQAEIMPSGFDKSSLWKAIE